MKFLYAPFFRHYNLVCITNFAEIDTFDNDLHSVYAKTFMLAYCNNVQMQYMHVVFYIFHAIHSFCRSNARKRKLIINLCSEYLTRFDSKRMPYGVFYLYDCNYIRILQRK